MSSDDISIPSRFLMKELNILNVYQTNILQHLLFMFRVKNSKTFRVFNQLFSLIDHLYPTRFFVAVLKRDFNLKLTRFPIVFRGPTIWNNFFTESEKCYSSIDVFKNKMKEKILYFSNEFLFFKVHIITSNPVFLLYKAKHVLFIFCISLLIACM